ncbi:MAG TPA: acyl-CoA dehydrogenase family protein [Acidimicrobiales bacterium]|nr:acyl-CoA dehydrogenase family protein [Acidimicrobiales bacterium]
MDLTTTPDQERLRRELRDWLRRHLPWDYGVGLPPRFHDLAEEVAFGRRWQSELAAAGWVGVTWPVAYGGRGLGPGENFVVQEELARARAPELVGRIGVNLAGPTLLAHGSDAQKERFLPAVLSAAELWCQLFSEPDAGSDLAAVRTTATRAPGGWVLNGQKVWTSYAQFADWAVCLARSDPSAPKHKGLSFYIVDMHAEGVEVRPLVQLTGEAEFNEVVLHDVVVGDDHLVGAEGAGWRVAGSTLSHERGVNPRQLVIHMQHLEELLRTAASASAFDDPRLRRRLAQAYVEVRLFQLHNWRSLSKLERGLEPGPEGSILKLYWSEMSKRLHELALDVLGPAAPLWRDATDNPGDGSWQRAWLYYQAASIFAGTNEIQHNVIGERVLGLPREPEPPMPAPPTKEAARGSR